MDPTQWPTAKGRVYEILQEYPQSTPKKVPVRRGGLAKEYPRVSFELWKDGEKFLTYQDDARVSCVTELTRSHTDEIRISEDYDLEKHPLPEWCELVTEEYDDCRGCTNYAHQGPVPYCLTPMTCKRVKKDDKPWVPQVGEWVRVS